MSEQGLAELIREAEDARLEQYSISHAAYTEEERELLRERCRESFDLIRMTHGVPLEPRKVKP